MEEQKKREEEAEAEKKRLEEGIRCLLTFSANPNWECSPRE